jgi:serine/threonine protein kinase
MPQPSIPCANPFEGSAYRALRRIAVGGDGEVFEAEHVALAKRVAIKVLRPRDEDVATSIERMRVEAQTLAHLRSPHLIEVSDCGHTADGRPFYVMELLAGRTLLQELRRRGSLPPREAVGHVQELLKGLAVAHRAGIVHRDVKLENLFLAEGPEGTRVLKILDFGIAKLLPHATGVTPSALRTADGTILGTPRYMAPEQVLGHAVDPRADVYAAAVVLYELLTGRDPFHDVIGTTPLLHATVEDAPPAPSRVATQPIAPALEDVVLRALAKRPRDRYGSAAELSAALTYAMETPVVVGVVGIVGVVGVVGAVPDEPAGLPAPGVAVWLAAVLVLGGGVISALLGLWLTRAR